MAATAAFSRAVEALATALRIRPEAEILALNKRIATLSLRVASSREDTGSGLTAQVGEYLGLTDQEVRLIMVAAASVLMWQHGRAVVRWCSIYCLSLFITLWALSRRLQKKSGVRIGGSVGTTNNGDRSGDDSRLISSAGRGGDSGIDGIGDHSRGISVGGGTESPTRPQAILDRDLDVLPAIPPSQLDATLRECFYLHEECAETLRALDLLRAVQKTIAEAAGTAAARAAQRTLSARATTVSEIRSRASLAREALVNVGNEDGWSEPIDAFGSRTRFRRAGSGGQLTLRVDGIIEDVPLADVLAVWREIALYPEWLPSCISSTLLRTKKHCDVLFHMGLSLLGVVSRDAVVHAYPINALREAGCIMLLGRSVDASDMPDDSIPPPPSWPLARMEYRKLQVVLEPLGETTTRACLIFNVDPRLRVVPQSFVQNILKRSLCLLFWQLRRTARRIRQGEGAHAAAVAADWSFYGEWLHSRLKGVEQQSSAPAARRAEE